MISLLTTDKNTLKIDCGPGTHFYISYPARCHAHFATPTAARLANNELQPRLKCVRQHGRGLPACRLIVYEMQKIRILPQSLAKMTNFSFSLIETNKIIVSQISNQVHYRLFTI